MTRLSTYASDKWRGLIVDKRSAIGNYWRQLSGAPRDPDRHLNVDIMQMIRRTLTR